MRFYSEIRIEPRKHLDKVCNNPCLVFSTDFIHYLAALHDVAWCPIESRPGPYLPHPISPCTKNVKNATLQFLTKSTLNYKLLYEERVPADAENKLEIFIDRAQSILKTMTDDPMKAFLTFLHLGKWTLTFYTNGTKDAVHLVPYLMADALKKILENSTITVWFKIFDEYLEGLLKDGIAEEFIEEGYSYIQELETTVDFEECDVFQDCEVWGEESDEYYSDIYEEDDCDFSDEYDDCYMELEEFSEDTEDEENERAA